MDAWHGRLHPDTVTKPRVAKCWDPIGYDRTYRFVSDYGKEILRVLAPQPGERILDLGCGTGELTAEAARLGARVVGLDQDVAMIRRARQRYPQLCFELTDAHSFKRPAAFETLDAVFSNAALHWMLRPAEVIASVRSALRRGGRFVAETGGHGNVARVERALFQARVEAGAPARPSPWFFPTLATYARLLEEGGLEPQWMQLCDRLTPLAEGESSLADWMTMFASPVLEDLDSRQRAQVLDRTSQILRPALFADGRWSIDYRRLRFVAVRVT